MVVTLSIWGGDGIEINAMDKGERKHENMKHRKTEDRYHPSKQSLTIVRWPANKT